MFLFSDTQIKLEPFVEDLNALLNSGEVPNLFPYDERASVIEAVRPAATRLGRAADSPADLWNFFVDRTKANLHIVLCFSPIGDAFRFASVLFIARIAPTVLSFMCLFNSD
jgi:dynein heavy chain, axonemal